MKNKAPKMNILYKLAFILMFVCAAMLVAAIAVSYLFEKPDIAVLIAVGGAVLCVVAIVLVMFSKPKKPKPKKREKEETPVDNGEGF